MKNDKCEVPCDVCHERPIVGVYASRHGPFSHGLCQQCRDAGKEPDSVKRVIALQYAEQNGMSYLPDINSNAVAMKVTDDNNPSY
jgi:hypothetical protein